jgi:hypothetical protein
MAVHVHTSICNCGLGPSGGLVSPCCLAVARENNPATLSLKALAAPAVATAPCGWTGFFFFARVERSRLRCRWPSIPGARQYPLGSRHFLQAALGSAVRAPCAGESAGALGSSGGDTAGDRGNSSLNAAPSSTARRGAGPEVITQSAAVALEVEPKVLALVQARFLKACMALCLSGEYPRGPRRGANGSFGTPGPLELAALELAALCLKGRMAHL